MSSTKRGGQVIEGEFYPTPAWCVWRLLDHLFHVPEAPKLWHPGSAWLEPCAGSGAIVRAVESWRPVRTRNYTLRPAWSLCDIAPRADGLQVVAANYLEMQFPARFAVAITNPPFSLAMEFVRAMRADAGVVIVLQRMNWLGTEGRASFFRENTPDVFVLPNRPAFCVNAKGQPVTDSCDYAWFAWGLTTGGHIAMLDGTPAEVRRCHALEEASRVTSASRMISP